MDINLPEIVAEVTAEFDRYEKALVTNDVAVLDNVFREARRPSATASTRTSTAMPRSRRSARRARRSALGRKLSRTVITTYGRDFAVASTLYQRPTAPGRSAGRCRPGCNFPTAGASSPRM